MRRLVLASLVVTSAACQQVPGRAPETAAATPAASRAAASARERAGALDLDLSQVMATVRRAVRRDGDRLIGRGDHHQLSVDAEGRVRLATLDRPGAGGAPAELQLETSAITRGAVPLTGRATARADGPAVVVARGQVEERLVNERGGVEQRWHLPARPAGGGDLTISVRAAGLAYAGATAGGLHFGDPGRGAMVRYGLATWVDASGTRLPLATRFDAGAIRITVPAAALDAAAYPAVVDPVVSVERNVDQPPGGAGASGAQVKPSVACLAGGTCLVAWQDQVVQSLGLGTQLRAARVSGTTLAVLDPDGFDVDPASATTDCGVPIVLATSTGGTPEFAVVYSSNEQIAASLWRRRLKIVRISAAGALVGAPVQLSTDGNGDVFTYAAAAGPTAGSTVAMTWSDLGEVRFRTFSGGVAGPVVVPVLKSSVPPEESARWDRPAIAWTGTRWFLAWRGGIGTTYPAQVIRVAFLDAAGTFQPGETNGFYIMGTAGAGYQEFFSQPVAAGDGNGNALVLTASNTGGDPYPGLVRAMRFSPTGSDPVAWSIPNIPNIWSDGSVMGLSTWWNGSSFSVLLQYQVTGGWMTAQVRSVPATPFNLSVSDPAPPSALVPATPLFPSSSQVDAIQAAPDGAGGTLLAWEDMSSGSGDIRAARPAGGDARPNSLLLTAGAADEGFPAVAYSSGTWLVAWDDQRTVAAGNGSDLFAVRLAQKSGAPLDTTPLHLSSAAGFQGNAVAAGSASGFLVAWADGRAPGSNIDVYATRVSSAGVVSDPLGLAVAAETTRNEWPLQAAFDGTDYHLLYSVEDPGTPPNQVLRDVRLQPADLLQKGVLDVAVPADPTHRLQGSLACRAGACLASWAEELGSTILARGITGGAAVSTPVALVNGLGFTPTPVVSAAASGSPPFLVAWPDPDVATTTTTVNGRLAAADGASLGTVGLGSVTGLAYRVSASFDGFDHLVGWAPDQGGLQAGWIQASGAARASATTLVAGGLASPRQPVASAGDGEGRTLVAYSAFDAAPGVRARRVKVRLVSWSRLLGDTCATGGECASTFCVEGVCCDGACGGGGGCQTCAARNGHGTAGHCTATTGDACNDGQACTSGDTCQAGGACAGSSYTCTPSQCQLASACNGTGGCTATSRPDTTGCDDGDPCTHDDQCTGGTCAGTRRACTPPSKCQVASACDGTSACTFVDAPDGTACGTGTCQQGTCQGGPGAALGLSCGSGPAGGEALLLVAALLGLASRRRRSHP